MTTTLRCWLAAVLALFMVQTPLAAQDVSDKIAAWQEQISGAYALDWEERETAVEQFVVTGEAAEAELATGNYEGEDRIALLEIIGTAYFGAAQHHDSEWDSEADTQDREWLVKTVTALEPVMAARGAMDGPAYDFRGAAGQLFNHGRYYDLPEWKEWSRMRVLGNRYMSVDAGDMDGFERELLAISLYEHGWLTSDDALIAEAEAIYASFPDDDRPYSLEQAHEAVLAGTQPYPDAGKLW